MTDSGRPHAKAQESAGGARPAEEIARHFHETYEYLAPSYGYETRRESAVDWEDVPEQNRKLMIHVVGNLLAEGIIDVGRSRG